MGRFDDGSYVFLVVGLGKMGRGVRRWYSFCCEVSYFYNGVCDVGGVVVYDLLGCWENSRIFILFCLLFKK